MTTPYIEIPYTVSWTGNVYTVTWVHTLSPSSFESVLVTLRATSTNTYTFGQQRAQSLNSLWVLDWRKETSLGASSRDDLLTKIAALASVTRKSVASTLTAHAGGGQSLATQLATDLNIVTTCATLADSVVLPDSRSGMQVTVTNLGAATCSVFGHDTDTIDTLAVGVAFSLATMAKQAFTCPADGAWVTGSITPRMWILTDEKAANTAGGTFTTGAWRTRDLTTIKGDPGTDVGLAANQFTLQRGTWMVHGNAPAYIVNRHQTRLRNITDGTTTEVGSSQWTASGSQGYNSSEIYAFFTITTAKVFELQHQCETTRATDGFGVATGSAFTVDKEVYSRMEIIKVG